MKKSNLYFVIATSVLAGYFAYPYFNRPVESIQPETQSRVENLSQRTHHKKNVKREHRATPIEDEAIPSNDKDLKGATHEYNQTDAEPAVTQQGHVNVAQKDQTSKTTGASTDSSRWYEGKEILDFTSYKLSQAPNRIELSPADPRLLLIRGSYQGRMQETLVELEIGSHESSLLFYNDGILNEELSFRESNEQFFTNVNHNGSMILIQQGKHKMLLSIKDWPFLKIILNETKIIHLGKK